MKRFLLSVALKTLCVLALVLFPMTTGAQTLAQSLDGREPRPNAMVATDASEPAAEGGAAAVSRSSLHPLVGRRLGSPPPLPASASGDESVREASAGRVLTLNGHPLWEVFHSPGRGAALAPLAAQGGRGDGQISGVVVYATGQPVADQRVELRQPSSEGPGRLIATTDTNGQFVYGRLGPGRYEVELRDEGRVIATSGPIELFEEAMRVSGVTVARRPRWGMRMYLTVTDDGPTGTLTFPAFGNLSQ